MSSIGVVDWNYGCIAKVSRESSYLLPLHQNPNSPNIAITWFDDGDELLIHPSTRITLRIHTV